MSLGEQSGLDKQMREYGAQDKKTDAARHGKYNKAKTRRHGTVLTRGKKKNMFRRNVARKMRRYPTRRGRR